MHSLHGLEPAQNLKAHPMEALHQLHFGLDVETILCARGRALLPHVVVRAPLSPEATWSWAHNIGHGAHL